MSLVHTTRLHLRPLAEADETLFCALFTDAGTMRFIGPALSRERALRTFLKTLESTRREPPERIFLAVIDRASGQSIGISSLQHFDALRRSAEIGIMLRPALHARGYAREAVAALTAHAFAKLQLDQVWSRIGADHSVAERVLIGVGFAPDGMRDEQPGMRVWSIRRDQI